MWKDPWWVAILTTHPQFVHLRIGLSDHWSWILSVVYGRPTPLRKSLWKDLTLNLLPSTDKWLLVSDFNLVLSSDEVSNQRFLNQ